MELTRFDLQNQAIQRRIADALERIAAALELSPTLLPTRDEQGRLILYLPERRLKKKSTGEKNENSENSQK